MLCFYHSQKHDKTFNYNDFLVFPAEQNILVPTKKLLTDGRAQN